MVIMLDLAKNTRTNIIIWHMAGEDNYGEDLRIGTGVEVSRSASENCPTATPTRHNTRPCNMKILTTMIFTDHEENADRNNCDSR